MSKVNDNLKVVQTSLTDWSRDFFKGYQWKIRKEQGEWEQEMAKGGSDLTKLRNLEVELHKLLEKEEVF